MAADINPGQVILMQIVVEKGAGKGTIFHLHDGINTLGRDMSNRIRLVDLKVSRNHCKIRKIGLSVILSDLGARNGTFVNGKMVSECEIKVGDSIAVGSAILKVVDDDYAPSRDSAQAPAPFSFFRKITMALSGVRSQESPPSDIEESQAFHKRNRKAIWKAPPGADAPESRLNTFVPTDPDPD